MKKNYLNEGMKLLLVGICLVLAAAFSETAVDGLLWGFAGGALAPGIARIIQHFYWSAPKNQVRYQEMKEQADINLHDELNEKLRDKSGRIAYLIGLLIICISEVVYKFKDLFFINNCLDRNGLFVGQHFRYCQTSH